MRNKLYIKLSFIKILLFFNVLISSLLYECNRSYPILKNNQCLSIYCTDEEFKTGECIIDEPITKVKWLNNIIKFEKTNGELFFFSESLYFKKIIFSTSSSNNNERIFYGIYFENNDNKYIFKNNDTYEQYIKKRYNKNSNLELINPQMHLIHLQPTAYYYRQVNYIILIGTQNSSIELFDINNYKDNLLEFNSSYFLNDTNRIIKGKSSLTYFYKNKYFLFVTVTSKEEKSSINYLSLYNYKFHNIQNNNNTINMKLIYENDSDFGYTKGDFISCFIFTKKNGDISCFYLNYKNFYIINVIKNNYNKFELKNETIIGSPSNINNDNLYFLKSIYIDEYKAIYSYFSGKNDNIPTFLIMKIDKKHYFLNYLYTDFPIIKLYDYIFNNDINYNDLVRIKKESNFKNEFFFISTNYNKNIIIIAFLRLFRIEKQQLIIRYYTIKLQEYYNFKILNGFKVVNYNFENLILSIDFCNYDTYQNLEQINNHNAALIFLSFLNRTSKIEINFIEYALKIIEIILL